MVCALKHFTHRHSSMANKNTKAGGKKKVASSSKLILPPGLTAQGFVRYKDNLTIGLPALDSGYSFAFNLAQVPDSAEFTSLYDAYIIDQVDMRFVLTANADNAYPVLLAALDYDDASAMSSQNEILTRQGAMVMPFSATVREHTVSVKPRVAMTAFRSGVSSAYGWGAPNQLIDIALTDVPYYGIRTWFTNYNTTDTPGAVIRVFIKYHMRFVGQR